MHISDKIKMIRRNKKNTVILLIVLAMIASVIFLFLRSNDAEVQGGGYDFPGPTQDELDSVQEYKESYSEPDNPEPADSVRPVITSVNQDELRALIPQVFQEGGKCTATYSGRGTTFTKTSSATANVSDTICEPIYTNSSDFAYPGTWSVTVTYEYNSTTGTSEASSFEVTK